MVEDSIYLMFLSSLVIKIHELLVFKRSLMLSLASLLAHRIVYLYLATATGGKLIYAPMTIFVIQ